MACRLARVVFAGAVVVLAGWTSMARAQSVVYVIRHGHREPNHEELSPLGKAQAAHLARLLENAGITSIYTSDVPRTKDTADPLAARRSPRCAGPLTANR